LIRRFTGRNGRQKLIEALKEQQLVNGSEPLAKQLADCAECKKIPANRVITKEGNSDNDIHFILCGSVSVTVKGRQIAIRDAGEHIGEMALIDKTALRSATVCALENTVILTVTEQKFSRIANNHPEIWRKIAVIIASRLRERNKFHSPPRSEPVVFIGSSSEGLAIAEKVDRYLRRYPFVPKLWSEEVFECSKTTIEDLMTITKQSDFAILILTPDDVVKARGRTKPSPRDNVIFELGLFMGAITRERTFIVAPQSTNLKIPTDLLGVTCLFFKKNRGKTLAQNLRPVLKKLRELIQIKGPI
jgi:CRP/FNR family transcriptional regulator, cyclic AMP receptor protein